MRSTIDPRSPKDGWEEQRQLAARDPMTWALVADKLIASFEHLTDQMPSSSDASRTPANLQSVALMLAAFATEAMVKGIVASKVDVLTETGRFRFGKHDVLSMLEVAGIIVDQDEHLLLERLEQFGRWAGRYPIPLEVDDMRPRTTAGGFSRLTDGQHDLYIEQSRALMQRLRAELPRIRYR